MRAFYTCFLKICLALNSYKFYIDLLYQILGRLNSRILWVFVDLRHQWKDKAAPDPAERHDQDHSRNHIRCWKVCYFVHTETGCQHENS